MYNRFCTCVEEGGIEEDGELKTANKKIYINSLITDVIQILSNIFSGTNYYNTADTDCQQSVPSLNNIQINIH